MLTNGRKNTNFYVPTKKASAPLWKDIGFTNKDDDYEQKRKACLDFYVSHPKDKDLYKIGIIYNDIK